MNRKQTVWWLLAAAFVTLIASVAVYWEAVVMLVAPQIPLRQAMETAIIALEERYQESPVPILLQGYDPDGLNTAQVELAEEGSVKGILEVRANLEDNQIFLRGTLPKAAQLGSVSAYLDQDRIALTSDTLLQGGYYGITYNTFRQDIQKIPLVSLLVPEQLISQWEDSLGDLQKKLNWAIALPELPEIPMEQIKAAPAALWLLRGRTSVQDLEVGGQMQPCWKVAYRLKEKTAGLLWETLLYTPMPENGKVQFAFYLYGRSLVCVELNIEAGQQQIEGLLTLGPDAKTDDLHLSAQINGSSQNFSLTTKQGRETLQFNGLSLSYRWDPAQGDFTLYRPEPLPMKLTPAPDGFQIQSSRLWENYDCTLTVTKGTQIEPPACKNLDQWSLEDLLIFLNGVWTLIQPKIG